MVNNLLKTTNNVSMDKIIFFSAFQGNDTNRGCQALSYGALHLISNSYKTGNITIISPSYYIRKKRNDELHIIKIKENALEIKRRYYWLPEIIITSILIKLFGKKFEIGKFGSDMERLEHVYSINGGDGFSDIYSSKSFTTSLWPSIIGVFLNKNVTMLPQTIGPFSKLRNRKLAEYVLKKANKVYVRDLVFADQLKELNVPFILSNDVSYYMIPQKVNITIENDAIGINISGLAYYNNFRNLKGRFPYYKELIIKIIEMFQMSGKTVYLIPHTYNSNHPEIDSDDLQAAIDIHELLGNKLGVKIINGDYIAPELKYIISKFDFFIGNRMHANFAAIYSNVPVFGLSYSYKFSGTFNQYGLNDHYCSVIDLKEEDIQDIITKIEKCYSDRQKTKAEMILRSEKQKDIDKILV